MPCKNEATLDTVRIVPVFAGTRGRRAVAVAGRSISCGRTALSAVVVSVGSGLVLALSGAALSDRAATIGRGAGACRCVGRVLLDTVVGRSRHTRHIPGRRLIEDQLGKHNSLDHYHFQLVIPFATDDLLVHIFHQHPTIAQY